MTKKTNPFRNKTPKEATGFLLWKAHNYWQREIKKCLKEFDLTHTQFVILANTQWLVLHQDEVTQIQISQHAETDVMMTSNVIRTLEKKGLLKRTEHKTDTRAKLVDLTNEGINVFRKAVKKVEEFDHVFFNKVEDTPLFNKALLELMEKE